MFDLYLVDNDRIRSLTLSYLKPECGRRVRPQTRNQTQCQVTEDGKCIGNGRVVPLIIYPFLSMNYWPLLGDLCYKPV